MPKSAWELGNWVSSMLQARPVLAFGIDRAQRIRPVGLLSLVNGTPLLFHLQYPPEYYNFELAREKAAWKGEATTVSVFDEEAVNGAGIFVDLPPAEKMATFDTLEIDLSQYCAAHDDQNCFEWDYKAFIEVREYPVEESNPDAETPCQPAVAEAEGVEPVAADTLACGCVVPGTSELRDAEKVCKPDGAGFGDCACNQKWEIARWITTYHREGRWVMDASPFLPLLKSGGKTRLHRQLLRLRQAGRPGRGAQPVRHVDHRPRRLVPRQGRAPLRGRRQRAGERGHGGHPHLQGVPGLRGVAGGRRRVRRQHLDELLPRDLRVGAALARGGTPMTPPDPR